LAGVIFTTLLWIVVQVMNNYISPHIQDGNTGVQVVETTGSKIDVTVSETPENHRQPEERPDFVPLAARQIDPNLNNVINSDPEKVADIVRKMGFDEESE